MQIGDLRNYLRNYRFRPQLIPSLATAMLIPLFLHLGNWQADKAEAKAAQQARLEQRMQAAPQNLPAAIADAELLRYLRVRVRGHYDAAHSLLLDNQIHAGRAGFYVITPLRLDDGRSLLINRGWVPFSGDRSQLPQINTPSGEVEIVGHLLPPASRAMDAAYLPKPGEWTTIWPTLNMDLLAEAIGTRQQPVVLRMDADSAGEGFLREWERPDERLEMHRSYAMQWRLITSALVLAWFFLSFRKKVAA